MPPESSPDSPPRRRRSPRSPDCRPAGSGWCPSRPPVPLWCRRPSPGCGAPIRGSACRWSRRSRRNRWRCCAAASARSPSPSAIRRPPVPSPRRLPAHGTPREARAEANLEAQQLSAGADWSDLVATPLLDDPLVGLLPAGHPLAGRGGPVELAELAEEQWIMRLPAVPGPPGGAVRGGRLRAADRLRHRRLPGGGRTGGGRARGGGAARTGAGVGAPGRGGDGGGARRLGGSRRYGRWWR